MIEHTYELVALGRSSQVHSFTVGRFFFDIRDRIAGEKTVSVGEQVSQHA